MLSIFKNSFLFLKTKNVFKSHHQIGSCFPWIALLFLLSSMGKHKIIILR